MQFPAAIMEAIKIKTQLLFNCGCGFQCNNQKEAEAHCQQKGHVLTVHGKIARNGNS